MRADQEAARRQRARPAPARVKRRRRELSIRDNLRLCPLHSAPAVGSSTRDGKGKAPARQNRHLERAHHARCTLFGPAIPNNDPRTIAVPF